VLLLQNWGFTEHLTWNDPAWSISCELGAYLLFQLLALAIDYQAKSIKKNLYEVAAAQGGPTADAMTANAKRNEQDSAKIQADAKALEQQVDEKLTDSELHTRRHHILTLAVTLLHIAIAIATLSIIMRGRRWPWHGSLALGVIGLLAAGFAYL